MPFQIINKKPVLPEALLRELSGYIAENYIDPFAVTYCSFAENDRQPALQRPKRKCLEKASAPAAAPASLAEMLRQADAGFSETLMKLIDQSGKKDSYIYKKANISKQHFSKIRSNPDYRPTKPTAIALALALELDMEDTLDLIGRAGFTLTNSSKFDLIIQYFIQQKNYDVIQINLALYEFDQPLLGA